MLDIGVNHFSKHLFWDMDINQLEIKKDKHLIIERVFTYGKENDERLLFNIYDAADIKKTVKKSHNLNLNTILYLSAILNIPKEKFKCISQIKHDIYLSDIPAILKKEVINYNKEKKIKPKSKFFIKKIFFPINKT